MFELRNFTAGLRFCVLGVLTLAMPVSTTLCAQAEEQADRDDVEEVIVTEQRLPEELNPVQMQRVRDANGKGARLYRHGKYGEAFPYLLAAAKRGFKLSQARVGYIYQEGLGGVERNAFAAIGWMGVAATADTTPEIRKHFKAMMKAVPEPFRPQAESIVADYRERYGSENVGTHCYNTRWAGTHISRLTCTFDNEFDFRDGVDSNDLDGLLNAPTLPPPEEN